MDRARRAAVRVADRLGARHLGAVRVGQARDRTLRDARRRGGAAGPPEGPHAGAVVSADGGADEPGVVPHRDLEDGERRGAPLRDARPAEEYVEKRLDPSEFLIDQKDATFFVTIQGYSMIDVGLLPGDKAVIDRSKLASIGDIVLAVIDGEFTIKTLARKKDGSPRLLPANSTGVFNPIEIKEGMNFEIWGVVTSSFRRFKK